MTRAKIAENALGVFEEGEPKKGCGSSASANRTALNPFSTMAPASAQGEKRVALLIGNQAYNAKVGPLKNPHDDVMLVSAALRSLGFAVTAIRDADYRSMDAAIKRHAAAVRREGQGTVSLLYYSGHGANMEKNQASTALVKPRMPLTPSILAAGSLADGGCALKRMGAPI